MGRQGSPPEFPAAAGTGNLHTGFGSFVDGCNQNGEVGGGGGLPINCRASKIQGCKVLGNALAMPKKHA